MLIDYYRAVGPPLPPRTVRFNSLASAFSTQLRSLMDTLTTTTPYFVRCINPNNRQRHTLFDPSYVRPQLRYCMATTCRHMVVSVMAMRGHVGTMICTSSHRARTPQIRWSDRGATHSQVWLPDQVSTRPGCCQLCSVPFINSLI